MLFRPDGTLASDNDITTPVPVGAAAVVLAPANRTRLGIEISFPLTGVGVLFVSKNGADPSAANNAFYLSPGDYYYSNPNDDASVEHRGILSVAGPTTVMVTQHSGFS